VKTRLLSHYALSSCAAAAMLAGCGGSQPPISVPLAAQQVNGVSAHPLNNGGYKLLYSFKGGSDGQLPFAGLIFVKGLLYGTTSNGGCSESPCCTNGCGTVFRMSTTGSKKVIYSFKGPPDAEWPQFALLNLNGTLYSTTQGGGSGCSGDGCGTVFSITTSGAESVLYSFKGGTDGESPFASLIAVNGKLYGTTYFGGGSTRCAGGCGTVFEMDTSGRERILHRFRGYPHDGEGPIGALVAVNGELYGTTWIGGSGASCHGCGTIFEVSTSGKERVLYNFNGPPDGENPEGALVNVGGALYGTTTLGGTGTGCTSYGCGTFFRLIPSSMSESYSVIYSFVGGRNSMEPNGGLLPLNGIFYGTAAGGNKCGSNATCGTVFDVSKSGKERLLHRFHQGGGGPGWPLVARNGLIYGTTFYGGASKVGAVYSIEP
jgi:uncharacterized repeat protein (TIGR03803 family)